MPRLVLVDDDRKTVIFESDVSRANVELVARFLGRHLPKLRAAAAVKREFDETLDQIRRMLGPAPALPPPVRRRRVPR